MADLNEIEKTIASVVASPQTITLLRKLHKEAVNEEAYVSVDLQPVTAALDRFVALDPDKCALVYLLLRSSGARYVVELGTSFGLSTIYLALAVSQNAKLQKADGKVIGTENEPTKVARAREHWKAAGDEVEKWIDLKEGNFQDTLKVNLPDQIDFVLLDIWSPLALPALKMLHSRLKVGALVVADNVVVAAEGYKELMSYMDDQVNGFKKTTAPYSGGLLVAVFMGKGNA